MRRIMACLSLFCVPPSGLRRSPVLMPHQVWTPQKPTSIYCDLKIAKFKRTHPGAAAAAAMMNTMTVMPVGLKHGGSGSPMLTGGSPMIHGRASAAAIPGCPCGQCSAEASVRRNNMKGGGLKCRQPPSSLQARARAGIDEISKSPSHCALMLCMPQVFRFSRPATTTRDPSCRRPAALNL